MANHKALPEPAQIDREIKVLELRRAGLTWQRIAEQTGYKDHSGAYAAYKRAMKRTQQQPADELREQELDRIDRLQLAIWQKALQGDTKAIMTIIKLMERRARILGLDAPTRIQQDVITWNGDESIDRAVRDLAALLTANDAISAGESSMAGEASEILAITAGDELANVANPLGSRLGENSNGSGVDSLASASIPEDPMGSSSAN